MKELSPIDVLNTWYPYDKDNLEIAVLRGLNKDYKWDGDVPRSGDEEETSGEGSALYSKLNSGEKFRALLSKVHVIKIDGIPGYDDNLREKLASAMPMTFSELCKYESKSPALEYYPDDFLYLTKLGYPLNHLITLRRFPFPCIDNILDETVQKEQDVCRMVGYFDQEINKLEEILTFSYGLRWKELTAEMEQAQMIGDQEGLSGFMKKVAAFSNDETLIRNRLRGPVGNQIDPKHDQNKVYGPVDSIIETHIRDIGFDFEKDFEITFDYIIRSWGGRTPEFVMKDILANILLCTFNDGDFWPGSRYWQGVQPSKLMNKFKWMNSGNMDETMKNMYDSFKGLISTSFGSKGSALQTLKNIIQGGIGMAMASILNKLGRPGIVQTNSLLSGSPVGLWHLTIGHPLNPILTMGDLICTGVEISFPEDSLSYGDFITRLVAKVKLKPSKPRDRAGIEMMFNHGQSRIYFNEKEPKITINKDPNMGIRKSNSNDGISIKEGIIQTSKYIYEDPNKVGSGINMKVVEKSKTPPNNNYKNSTGDNNPETKDTQEKENNMNQHKEI